MALVTVARYRTLTGEVDSSNTQAEGWIADATARLEDALDRPLESAARTERMYPTRDGSLWPHAIPITDGGAYTVDGYRLIGPGPFPVVSIVDPQTWVDVTYTGGWVERSANPTAPNRLPASIEEDIAVAAFLIGHPLSLAAQVAVPAGAQSVSLGDASINFGSGGAPVARPTRIRWTAKTLGYRYLRLGGESC